GVTTFQLTAVPGNTLPAASLTCTSRVTGSLSPGRPDCWSPPTTLITAGAPGDTLMLTVRRSEAPPTTGCTWINPSCAPRTTSQLAMPWALLSAKVPAHTAGEGLVVSQVAPPAVVVWQSAALNSCRATFETVVPKLVTTI